MTEKTIAEQMQETWRTDEAAPNSVEGLFAYFRTRDLMRQISDDRDPVRLEADAIWIGSRGRFEPDPHADTSVRLDRSYAEPVATDGLTTFDERLDLAQAARACGASADEHDAILEGDFSWFRNGAPPRPPK